MKNKFVFITVGTTQFNQLIQFLDNKQFYQLFKEQGYDQIIFQIGRGTYSPQPTNIIKSDVIRFSDTISQYFKNAALVISHCGAGTLLQCLKYQKRIIAIVNNTLADNHQLELFEELRKGKYIFGFEDYKKINVENMREMMKGEYEKYKQPSKCIFNDLMKN